MAADRGGRKDTRPPDLGIRSAAWLDSLAAPGRRSADDGVFPAGRPARVWCAAAGRAHRSSRHGMAPGSVVAAGKAPFRAGSDLPALLLVPVLAGGAGDRLGGLAKLDASPAGLADLVSRPGSG